jgi:prepilin signal peptidase PulO-like enzyme (type II secretory pathway)
MAFPLLLSFIFGAVIGSFLNVVSLRFNTGVGLHGRSRCMSCGTSLSWKELIPLFSFAMQKGACRKCKSKISWQYPLVEFVAGALFVLIIVAYPPLDPLSAMTTLFHLFSACLLLVIAAYDIKHKIIPDPLVYLFALIALAGLFVGGASWWHMPSLWALLAGLILALPFALLWLVSGGRWMGLGDAKLMLGIGWFLGIGAGINALILSFWIAAAVSLAWMAVRHGKFKRGAEIPFGPYLILGMYLVLLFGFKVIDLEIVGRLVIGV